MFRKSIDIPPFHSPLSLCASHSDGPSIPIALPKNCVRFNSNMRMRGLSVHEEVKMLRCSVCVRARKELEDTSREPVENIIISA